MLFGKFRKRGLAGGARRSKGLGRPGSHAVVASPAMSEEIEAALGLLTANRPAEAEQAFRRILAGGKDAQALHYLGLIQAQKGDREGAAKLVGEAVALAPSDASALSNYGVLLNSLGRGKEAIAALDRAVALAPNNADAQGNRALCLLGLGRREEALEALDKLLALRPDQVESHIRRADLLKDLKCPEEAVASYDRGLALKPDQPTALKNRAVMLRQLDRLDEAMADYGRALALAPNDVDILVSHGITLQGLARYDEALATYGQALAIAPDHGGALFCDGLCRLLLGDFERGWSGLEARWKTDEFARLRRNFKQPQWTGAEALTGKTILLHAEQGFGDTLQFCRYAPLVAAKGATVIMEVQRELKALLTDLPGVTKLISTGERLPAFDYHCPLMSLPLAFRTSLDSIPSPGPYLAARAAKRDAWMKKLGPRKRPRISLVWSGRPTHGNDRHRSIELAQIAKLLDHPADFFSLQKDIWPADMETLKGRDNLTLLGGALADFSDTAAVLSQMDLVISVDTAVAHLAGALGKLVWILLPAVPDWRWLLGREDSPWYASARLWRQPVAGDWESVLTQIKDALPAN
jgi:tetratricopeptide (TPR) repeat protein